MFCSISNFYGSYSFINLQIYKVLGILDYIKFKLVLEVQAFSLSLIFFNF